MLEKLDEKAEEKPTNLWS